MCIYVNENKIKTADRDIVCWKILEILSNDEKEVIVTPYAFKKVDNDILSGEKLFVPDNYKYNIINNKISAEPTSLNRYIVKEGFIHTYGNISHQHMLDELSWHIDCIGGSEIFLNMSDSLFPTVQGYALYKCIIPKGTRYFAGIYNSLLCNTGIKSYASLVLRFVDKVYEVREKVKLSTVDIYKIMK